MSKRLAALAERRRRLSEKIEAQRLDIAECALYWQPPLALVDTGLKTARSIYKHPLLAAGGVAIWFGLRRSGMIDLAQRGWRLLYLYPAILGFALKHLPVKAIHPPSPDPSGHPLPQAGEGNPNRFR